MLWNLPNSELLVHRLRYTHTSRTSQVDVPESFLLDLRSVPVPPMPANAIPNRLLAPAASSVPRILGARPGLWPESSLGFGLGEAGVLDLEVGVALLRPPPPRPFLDGVAWESCGGWGGAGLTGGGAACGLPGLLLLPATLDSGLGLVRISLGRVTMVLGTGLEDLSAAEAWSGSPAPVPPPPPPRWPRFDLEGPDWDLGTWVWSVVGLELERVEVERREGASLAGFVGFEEVGGTGVGLGCLGWWEDEVPGGRVVEDGMVEEAPRLMIWAGGWGLDDLDGTGCRLTEAASWAALRKERRCSMRGVILEIWWFEGSSVGPFVPLSPLASLVSGDSSLRRKAW